MKLLTAIAMTALTAVFVLYFGAAARFVFDQGSGPGFLVLALTGCGVPPAFYGMVKAWNAHKPHKADTFN